MDALDIALSRLAWSGNGTETETILLDELELVRGTPTIITRDVMVDNADQQWLYRDQRNSALRASWNSNPTSAVLSGKR